MTQPPVSAHSAFELAARRWFAATGEAGRLEVDEELYRFATIGEVLYWAVAIDEQMEHTGGPDELCDALRFARNRGTHDLMVTIDEQPGAMFPIRFPFKFAHYTWRDADSLPLPSKGMGSGPGGRTQRDAYRNTWQGRPVDTTLRELGAHLGVQLTG